MNVPGLKMLCATTALAAASIAWSAEVPTAATAGESRKAFEQLYGQQIRAVKATPGGDDDVALGRDLLKAAGDLKDQPELLAVMCGEAFGLTQAHADDVALDAMKLLGERIPGKAVEAREQMIKLLRAMHGSARGEAKVAAAGRLVIVSLEQADALLAAGKSTEAITLYRHSQSVAAGAKLGSVDSIKAKLDFAAEVARNLKQAEQFKTALKETPNDKKTAGALAMLLVTKFDNPAEAADQGLLLEPALAKNIALANKSGGDLTAEEALQLAAWYAQLYEPERGTIRARLVSRAIRYNQRFLEAYAGSDLPRVTAELQLKKLEKELAALAEANPALADSLDGKWVALFHSKTQVLPTGTPSSPKNPAAIDYKDGALTLSDFGGVPFPVQTQNLLVRAKVTIADGGSANITLRNGPDGWYIFRCYSAGHFAIFRSGKGTGKQIAEFKDNKPGKNEVLWTVAALGDVLLVFSDGKPVLRLEDKSLISAGDVSLYGMNRGATFKEAAWSQPSKAQYEKLRALATVN
jgi:hypothetical protein